ncbi:transketolase, C-terminal section [Rhodopseudomonas palustris]|uniref:transketolase family protein n=1 Tax=Rhodopseudomonas palustris TaxID=1076 RepID=UPI000D22309E|nr:transketolase C-terminal domain-containing protein [Rhodopseudomonas palustris]AVT78127.1 transketolase, C-terminal section [Rhodopseudomonas palustris]
MSDARPIAMRDAFLERIWRAMEDDEAIFFACADFGSPVLDRIRGDYPQRFVNVGIAEQQLINVSAGLALEGYKLFAYAIAPFITMRCYEQIRVSLALLSTVRPMNVNLIGVGAGYSYVVSGPTHQCYEDLTLMRALPNMQVLSPADHVTAASLFDHCVSAPGPKYLRFDAQLLPVVYNTPPDLGAGFHVHRRGARLCLVATGYMLHTAFAAADRLAAETGDAVGVIDLFDLARFDCDALAAELSGYAGLVSLEEGFRGRGGMDALLFEFIARRGLSGRLLNIGVEGGYRFELGSRAELHEQVGIGPNAVTEQIKSFQETLR